MNWRTRTQFRNIYVCPSCGRNRKIYNALDALQLISWEDEYFHCESCNGKLVAESDKLASQEVGDGDSNARRQRRKIEDMLQNMEVQLKPFMEQINRVKDLPDPEFGTLQVWEARSNAQRHADNGESSAIEPSKSSHGQGYCGTPMPFLGDTKVEVDFSRLKACKGNDIKSEADTTSLKVFHAPWMIKQGMNLTKEQCGEVKQEAKMMDGTLAAKSRQVGVKSKRDENEGDDGDDNIDWEEAPVAGDANGNFKVNDLNVEADATAEDEDDIDWEEG